MMFSASLRLGQTFRTCLLLCLCIGSSLAYCGWTKAQHYESGEIAKKLKTFVKYYYVRREVEAKIDIFIYLLQKEPKWFGLGLEKIMHDFSDYMTTIAQSLDKFHESHKKKGHITVDEHIQFRGGVFFTAKGYMDMRLAEVHAKGANLTHFLIHSKGKLLNEEVATRRDQFKIYRLLGHLASMHIWLTPLPGNEVRSDPEFKIYITSKGSPQFRPHLFDIKSVELLQYLFSKLNKMDCSTIRAESVLLDIMHKYPEKHIQKSKFSQQEYTCVEVKYDDITSTILTYKLSLEQYAPYIHDLNERISAKLNLIEYLEEKVRFEYGFHRYAVFEQYNDLQRSFKLANTYFVKSV